MSPKIAILLWLDVVDSDDDEPGSCIMVFIDRSGRFFPAGAAPTGVDVSVVIAMEIDTLLFLLFGLLEKIVLWNPLVVKGL
jgi:hypothetical protein